MSTPPYDQPPVNVPAPAVAPPAAPQSAPLANHAGPPPTISAGSANPANGYTAPWSPTVQPQFGAALDAPGRVASSRLGRVALVFGLIASVVAPVAVAIAAVPLSAPFFARVDAGADPFGDLSWLAPLAGWELLGELALYAGSISGIVAIVAGIISIAQRRGRKAGVWAIVLGALGPIIFTGALLLGLFLGMLGAAATGTAV